MRYENVLELPSDGIVQTIESIFLMWKFTGDPIWRRRAWEIFQNIEKWTRLEHGYAALRRVDQMSSGHSNSMPRYLLAFIYNHSKLCYSYFLAETLKYLYLTFLDHDPWPLDKYGNYLVYPRIFWYNSYINSVFNTEAHPFPVFRWTEAEQQRWDKLRATRSWIFLLPCTCIWITSCFALLPYWTVVTALQQGTQKSS